MDLAANPRGAWLLQDSEESRGRGYALACAGASSKDWRASGLLLRRPRYQAPSGPRERATTSPRLGVASASGPPEQLLSRARGSRPGAARRARRRRRSPASARARARRGPGTARAARRPGTRSPRLRLPVSDKRSGFGGLDLASCVRPSQRPKWISRKSCSRRMGAPPATICARLPRAPQGARDHQVEDLRSQRRCGAPHLRAPREPRARDPRCHAGVHSNCRPSRRGGSARCGAARTWRLPGAFSRGRRASRPRDAPSIRTLDCARLHRGGWA